jgi:DNA-directed RNA polymerase specialized sigma24 family protein
MDNSGTPPEAVEFEPFVAVIRTRLQRVLVARYGVEVGVDLTADVEAWAWQNFELLRGMNNPIGYLYRVAQSKARPHLRWNRRNSFSGPMPENGVHDQSLIEMHDLMSQLSENQRVCVLLVHAFGWTYRDVAETLEMSTASVGNHVTRGLARLRGEVTAVNDPLLENQRNERRHD